MQIFKPAFVTLATLVGMTLLIAGCGSSGGPDPKTEQVRMNSAVEMRKLFDKAGGDYAKLEGTDKVTFEKLAGGAANAEKTWGLMKGGPVSSGPSNP